MDETNTGEVDREFGIAAAKAERLCRLMDLAVSEGNTERAGELKGEIIEVVKEAGRLLADKNVALSICCGYIARHGYEKKDDKNVTEGF